MPAKRVCVSDVQFSFWRSNIFLFLVAWSRGLHLWRDFKINSRCYWRYIFSRQVLFQQREMRISWRLCNNSDIHSWFWKVWSLVVCSQGCFYVTRARKDDKNRRNTLFLCWKRWTWYPTNNCYRMSLFNQPNIERKNCVWTTKYKRTKAMCIVQHVELESVFTFQSIKRLVSTTVKSAKPAATFWKNLVRAENLRLYCLAVTVHIVLQERPVTTLKRKNHIPIWRHLSANQIQAHPNLNQ